MKEQDSQLPVLILTGASGFIGRHFLISLCDKYYIYALARRSQKSADIPSHKNISWIRVDIGNEREIKRVLNKISLNGGADYLLHFAGYFDFHNKNAPEYTRTNISGTKYILETAGKLNLRRFIFASSLAILDFSDPARIIDEHSVPDAVYPYAISKIAGEKLVEKFSATIPSTVIRFAAIFSDWCEHPPLYSMLCTWFSRRWDHRILAGKGNSAIPYLHINDLIHFLQCLLNVDSSLPRFHVLNASTGNCTSHRELFKTACAYNYFQTIKPIFLPKWFITVGLLAMNFTGVITGKKRFERLWMMKYIDKQLRVDSSQTKRLLNWEPQKRFTISRRLLFMIAKMKSNPYGWHYRNKVRISYAEMERPYIKIYEAMLNVKDDVVDKTLKQLISSKNAAKFSTYQKLKYESLSHRVEYIFKMLEVDVCTGDRSHILDYAQNLAEERFIEKFPSDEVINAIKLTANVVIDTLLAEESIKEMKQRIYDEIMLTLQMVMDEIEDTYERLSKDTFTEKNIFSTVADTSQIPL